MRWGRDQYSNFDGRRRPDRFPIKSTKRSMVTRCGDFKIWLLSALDHLMRMPLAKAAVTSVDARSVEHAAA